MRVIFYHGLEGTPLGDKPTALRKVFPNMEAPDFHGVDPTIRLQMAADDIRSRNEPVFLIGSSLGGVTAAIMGNMFPNLVKGYLLCAPAMHFNFNYLADPNRDYGEKLWNRHAITNSPRVAKILLGGQDSVMLNDEANNFASYFGIPVVTVDDGHRLANQIDLIVNMAVTGYSQAMQA